MPPSSRSRLRNASNLLSVIEPAVAPDVARFRRGRCFNALLAAIVGLLVAAGGRGPCRSISTTRIKDPTRSWRSSGLSTLGTIARMKGDQTRSEMYRLAALLYPRSGVAEAYRTLRTNIEFASVDGPIRTLLVTSSIPGEGKTITAANLAVVFAQAGRRVLLVDADLRKPGVHVDLRPAQHTGPHDASAQRRPCNLESGRPGDRAGEPPNPDDGPAAAQPGRAARLAADARDPRPPQGRRRPGHLRQPAAPGRSPTRPS